ncbi:MAG: hypothetical protein M3R66_07645 [Actinomycetota bacterium]|nr:hypothetical protein [Actinomycetota bacterium]
MRILRTHGLPDRDRRLRVGSGLVDPGGYLADDVTQLVKAIEVREHVIVVHHGVLV